MKYVILRVEDYAPSDGQTAALLDGAKTLHLQHLAQAGAVGTIYQKGDLPGIDRVQLHRALFGLEPRDPEGSPGRCYAAGASMELADGETAWCCELITHRDGAILDPTAGNIPTKESQVLIHALDERLGSDARRWSVGQGSHHVLVVRDPALTSDGGAAIRSPELLIGQAWTRALPGGALGLALRSVIEEGAKLLEDHPINRVRADLGENPANLVWYWGAGQAEPQRTFTAQTGLSSGAVVSDSFLMRGFSRTLGLTWKAGPASFEEPALQRLMKTVSTLLDRQDFVYVHLRVQTADPVQRLCAMERIDHALLKPLTERLPDLGPWRLMSAIDDPRHSAVPFVAIGSGLPQQPASHLTWEQLAESPLAFENGAGLFSWFTQP